MEREAGAAAAASAMPARSHDCRGAKLDQKQRSRSEAAAPTI